MKHSSRSRSPNKPAHTEDGSLTAAVEFDYEIVERNVFSSAEPAETGNQSAIDASVILFQRFTRWVFQDGKKNADGVKIRAMIVCWIFIPELRSLTETDLAIGFGMKKQSIGRWVEQWKRDFPHIRSPHMRPL
jgi:hypothetical protein